MSQHDAAPQTGHARNKSGLRLKLLLLTLLVLVIGVYGAMQFTCWRPSLPGFARAAAAASPRDERFTFRLQQLRHHLARYRRDHRNQNPNFQADNNPWHQMMSKTDESGVPGPDGEFGPYLQQRPANPLNGFPGVEVVDGAPAKGTRFPMVGWVVDRQSGQIWGTTAKMEVDLR